MADVRQRVLDDFLSELSQCGLRMEPGEFTLDSLRAQQKLAKFQLPSPELWAVKIVQAATVAKASWMEITFSRRRVSLEFLAPTLLNAKELTAKLFSGNYGEDELTVHLLTGIRAATQGHTLEMSMVTRTAEIDWAVNFSEKGLMLKPSDQPPPDTGCRFQLSIERPPASFWQGLRSLEIPIRQLLNQTASEYCALANSCSWCPFPFKLDGVTLPKVLPFSVSLADNQYLLRRRLPPAEGAPELPHHLPETTGSYEHQISNDIILQQPVYQHQSFLRWTTERKGPEFYLRRLPRKEKGYIGTCSFYCDGVFVQTVPINWTPAMSKHQQWHTSLELTVPIKLEDLDLSQFKVRNLNQFLEPLFQQLKETLLQSLSVLEEHLKYFKPRPGLPPPNDLIGRLEGKLDKLFLSSEKPSSTLVGNLSSKELRREFKQLRATFEPKLIH